jgi:hypothetical protein
MLRSQWNLGLSFAQGDGFGKFLGASLMRFCPILRLNRTKRFHVKRFGMIGGRKDHTFAKAKIVFWAGSFVWFGGDAAWCPKDRLELWPPRVAKFKQEFCTNSGPLISKGFSRAKIRCEMMHQLSLETSEATFPL